MKNFKKFVCAVVLGVMVWGSGINPVSACDGCIVQPVDENQYIEMGRILNIFYDEVIGDYFAYVKPININDQDHGWVFALDTQAPYNELIESALNTAYDDCMVQLTIDDNGNGVSDDDFVWRAMF